MSGFSLQRDVPAKAATPSRRLPAVKRKSVRQPGRSREIVVVLGMHRSGTSLLANILHLLGVDMVDGPTHRSIKNETGFWERPDIVTLHDDILAAIGAPIGNPRHAVPFPADWWRATKLAPLANQLRDLVAGHLAHTSGPWGFKDPRTCRLLPMWTAILQELGLVPRYIWAVRHPAEAALSMSHKNPVHRPLSPVESEINWLAYNFDILRHAGGQIAHVVPYDAWFEDAAGTASKLAGALGISSIPSIKELAKILSPLIRKDLRHHTAGAGRTDCQVGVSEDVYRGILAIPSQGLAAAGGVAETMKSMFEAATHFAMAASETKALREEVADLKARVAGLESQHARSAALTQRQQENLQLLQRKLEGNRLKLTREREAYGVLKGQLAAKIKESSAAERDRKRNPK